MIGSASCWLDQRITLYGILFAPINKNRVTLWLEYYSWYWDCLVCWFNLTYSKVSDISNKTNPRYVNLSINWFFGVTRKCFFHKVMPFGTCDKWQVFFSNKILPLAGNSILPCSKFSDLLELEKKILLLLLTNTNIFSPWLTHIKVANLKSCHIEQRQLFRWISQVEEKQLASNNSPDQLNKTNFVAPSCNDRQLSQFCNKPS